MSETTTSKTEMKPVSDNAVADQLMKLERDCYLAFQQGEIDSLMDKFIGEDAIVCPPGFETVSGRENQRSLFKNLVKMDGFEFFWEPVTAKVSKSEDMGWVLGKVMWKMPGDQDSTTGKYISIWAKDDDGKWWNQVEMRNHT